MRLRAWWAQLCDRFGNKVQVPNVNVTMPDPENPPTHVTVYADSDSFAVDMLLAAASERNYPRDPLTRTNA